MSHNLEAENLRVKEIPSDGHCLYRAIADQLNNNDSNQSSLHTSQRFDFEDLRLKAAAYMREHVDEFAPFLGMDGGGEAFEEYCAKVASVSDAEWGGQLEIRALSECLRRSIYVYDATNVLKMGADYSTEEPLRISYHRHYYALGEHYNSLVSRELDGGL